MKVHYTSLLIYYYINNVLSIKFITSIMVNDVAMCCCENFVWFGYQRCETVHLLSQFTCFRRPPGRRENRRLDICRININCMKFILTSIESTLDNPSPQASNHSIPPVLLKNIALDLALVSSPPQKVSHAHVHHTATANRTDIPRSTVSAVHAIRQ